MPADDCVTVVSGLPRSGTSMMMQMLAAGGLPLLTDQQRAADRDNPRGYCEFEAVKRTSSDPAWVALAVGKAVKMVHLLLSDLPADYHYRVLLMKRPIDQVLASQQAMLQHLGKPAAATSQAGLARVFQTQLDQVEAYMALRSNFRVQQVDYLAVIRQPRASAQQIDRFLGGGLNTDAMAAAVDPSLYRNRS
ncbi:MAG: sulfotransferase domain-containing protein [Phycisphaeraceae bacterium]